MLYIQLDLDANCLVENREHSSYVKMAGIKKKTAGLRRMSNSNLFIMYIRFYQ